MSGGAEAQAGHLLCRQSVAPSAQGAHQPPLPACLPFLFFAQRPVATWVGLAFPCAHRLLRPPLASRLFSRHQAIMLGGRSVPLLEISVVSSSQTGTKQPRVRAEGPTPHWPRCFPFPTGRQLVGLPSCELYSSAVLWDFTRTG